MPYPALDPRVRQFILPTRIVWTSERGVANAGNLLSDDDRVCILERNPGEEPGSILLDFGRELHGGVRIDVPTTSTGQPARVRVRFGESASEAMGTPNQDHTIHDFDTLVAWMGHVEIGCTGFRFVRVDLLEEGVTISVRQIVAVFLFRPLEYQGSFECDDRRLNAIWSTGAYTVHLCAQDHVWDGIKRDRLVWIGDLHPELKTICAVFGNIDVVPASLDYARDHTPLPGWMNGISSYSLWWILCHYDWHMAQGDVAYLEAQRHYLVALLEQLRSQVDESGCERLEGHRFLEWPTSRDPRAIDAGLQALVVMSLRAGASLCIALGEEDAAREATAVADRAARYAREASETKQANALLVLAEMADPMETNARILARDPYRGLSPFYGYYVLQARAMAGDYANCLDLIRTYWGAMIDLGATTFWEAFDMDWVEGSAGIDDLVPQGKRDIHADFGDFCYKGLRHSLCHGWAGGPTAWLTEHVLGLAPIAPGSRVVRLAPHLGGLAFARGTFPTPHGVIRVAHEARGDGRIHSAIEVPAGVRIDDATGAAEIRRAEG